MTTNKSSTSRELSFQEMVADARASFGYHLEGYRSDLTEQIFLALERSGLTKTQFAEALGVSKGRVTQILDGTNNFTLETLARISDVLQTELRLTLRPRGWVQVREFTKPSFDPRVVANTVSVSAALEASEPQYKPSKKATSPARKTAR